MGARKSKEPLGIESNSTSSKQLCGCWLLMVQKMNLLYYSVLSCSDVSCLLCKFCLHLNVQNKRPMIRSAKRNKKHSQIINISSSSCVVLEEPCVFLTTAANKPWLVFMCCTHRRCTHKMDCGPVAHRLGSIIQNIFFLSNLEPAFTELFLNWCGKTVPRGSLLFLQHSFADFFPGTVNFPCRPTALPKYADDQEW